MVRSHGWQLPAHAFQVVAITVFFLLVVAYYVFFAPFVGSKPLEYGAIALYSPLALAVFFLYVRCTGINPADSGVLSGPDEKFGELNDMKGLVSESSGSVVHRQGSSEIRHIAEDGERGLLSICCGFLCGWAVVPDGCRDEPPPSTELEEDVLYCTLCNAEVHKFSKHCRSCDKCVDGFDHHCRWLNNCVGKKNYSSFIALMATSLILLALQCGTGSVVFALCFTDKSATNRRIVEKLGNGFSRAPFAAVVFFCSFISAAAIVPLAELFCFHILLMRKGITTYEYVVAMRAQNEQQGGSVEDILSVPSSPGSSTATGLTGSSSLGLQYRGAWCTPPRVFIEHQDEVIPHLEPGRVPSTVDPDSLPKDKKAQKRPVRISAWKLAKLNASEAVKAAVKARENSSVMKQISGKGAEADYSSSDIGSSRSSASTDFGLMRGKRTTEEGKFTASKLDRPRSRDDYNIHFDSGVTSSRSSISSPRHALDYSDGLSPLPSRPSYAPTGTLRLSTPRTAHDNTVRFSNLNPFSRPPRFSAPWAGGKFAPSDGSSVDSLDDRYLGTRQGNVKQNPVFSYIRQAWPDVGSGTENQQRVGTEPRQQGRESPDVVDINENSRRTDVPRKADDLLYPENSIFFGGPLIPGMAKPSVSNQQGQQGNLGNLRINAPTEHVGFRPVRGNPRSHSPVFNPPRFSNPGGFPPV